MKHRSKQEIGEDLTSDKPTLAVAFLPGGEVRPLKVRNLPWKGPGPVTQRRLLRWAKLRELYFGAPKPAKAAQRRRAK